MALSIIKYNKYVKWCHIVKKRLSDHYFKINN